MQKLSVNKNRIFDAIQIDNTRDIWGKTFNVLITITILLNLFVVFFSTFDTSIPYKNTLDNIEFVTMIIFLIEYVLRLWTADLLYPKESKFNSRWKYVKSFSGLVDLITFAPYFLPIIFPSGMIAFKMLRLIRILKLFQMNKNYNAFNIIIEVLNDKKSQLFSSIYLILVLMIASSLCMYGLEHEVQPDVFENAFSGIWWSMSTLLTVGYGDVYPITIAGKITAIFIAFLGVGLVAIPTGIISAGFVEHYTQLKRKMDFVEQHELNFVSSIITKDSPWQNLLVKDLILPHDLILIAIYRHDEVIIPVGDTKLLLNDKIIIGAQATKGDIKLTLKEIIIKEKHSWVNRKVCELDISRQTILVLLKRGNKVIIPKGHTMIKAGDVIIAYSKQDIDDIDEISDIDL